MRRCHAREILQERGSSDAATPHAVERSDEFDLGGSNAIRRHEIDRTGMRIRRSGRKHCGEPTRRLFGFRSLVHFADNFGFSLRASAKGALASSISPFSTWAAATLR